jgi:hypothetical protein
MGYAMRIPSGCRPATLVGSGRVFICGGLRERSTSETTLMKFLSKEGGNTHS